MSSLTEFVLTSVCLQLGSQLPSNFSSMSLGQRQDIWREVCRTTDGHLSLSDGDLVEFIRPVLVTDLQHRVIRVGVKQTPTLQYMQNFLKPDRWSLRMLDVLASSFNFRPQYVRADQPTGGLPGPSTANWTGLTSQLLTQDVEMTGSFLVETRQRSLLVSYGEPVGHSQLGLMVRRPEAQTRDDSLLAPFSSDVWVVLLVSSILMGPLMWLMFRGRVWLDPDSPVLTQRYSMNVLIWFVVTSLVKQGTTLKPSSITSRLLFVTWWLFITVITAFYTANLTAYMTFSALHVPVSDIDALSRSQMSWTAPEGDAMEMVLRDDRVLEQMERDGRGSFVSGDDWQAVITSVRSGDFVYIAEMSALNAIMIADYLASNRTCHVYTIPLQRFVKYSFAFPQHSQLKQIFDPFIRWLVMTGFTDKWQREAQRDARACAVPKGIQGTKLRNAELRMMYLVLIVTYSVAAGVLMLEIAWRRRRGSYKDHQAGFDLPAIRVWGGQKSTGDAVTTRTFVMRARPRLDWPQEAEQRVNHGSSVTFRSRTPIQLEDDRRDNFEKAFHQLKNRSPSTSLQLPG